MTQEVLESAVEITENDELTNSNFTVFQQSDKYLFSSAPDVAIQEEEEEIEEDDEWDDDDEWEDDEWDDDDEWEDDEWDDEEWTEEDD
jgi:hypothetical protein